MTISITALKAGDVVFDAHKEKMGNTTMRRMGVWEVYIKAVHIENGTVIASWNGNRDQTFHARGGKFSWRRSDPTKKVKLNEKSV